MEIKYKRAEKRWMIGYVQRSCKSNVQHVFCRPHVYLLIILSDENVISLEFGEKCFMQFKYLLDNENQVLKNHLANFKNNQEKLDVLYANIFANNPFYDDLFRIVKMVLILSHGNASVESGFSINKHMLVENLQEKSIIARRQVFDAILNKGGAVNINIDKKMKRYVKNAHFKYINDNIYVIIQRCYAIGFVLCFICYV